MIRRNDAFARLLLRWEAPRQSSARSFIRASDKPCSARSEAAERGLIDLILVGPEAKIRAVAEREESTLLVPDRVDADTGHAAAAAAAVAMARAGEVEALMKGSLATDELMGAIVPSATCSVRRAA